MGVLEELEVAPGYWAVLCAVSEGPLLQLGAKRANDRSADVERRRLAILLHRPVVLPRGHAKHGL